MKIYVRVDNFEWDYDDDDMTDFFNDFCCYDIADDTDDLIVELSFFYIVSSA